MVDWLLNRGGRGDRGGRGSREGVSADVVKELMPDV